MPMEILGIIFGALLVVKADWIVRNFGAVASAEKWMRIWGGSRLFWKLLGILVILISFMSIAGLLQPLLLRIFGNTIQGLS